MIVVEEKKKKTPNKNIVWTFVSLILAVFTINMVVKQSKGLSLSELMEVIASSDKLFLTLSVICSWLFVWFEAMSLKSILSFAGYKRSSLNCVLYSSSDIYFSAITPSASGGQPAAGLFMHRDNIPGGVITATLILNLMGYTLGVVIVGVAAIFIDPAAFMSFAIPARILIVTGFLVLTFFSVFFLCILRRGDKVYDFVSKVVDFLCDKKLLKHREAKQKRVAKAREDYITCSKVIAGKKRVISLAIFWNLMQRIAQIIVPGLIYYALKYDGKMAVTVVIRQCLITMGYNFVPIPGAMGVSDYLMIDGYSGIMDVDFAYQLEMITRGMTFYVCVAFCAIITLVGYVFWRKKK